MSLHWIDDADHWICPYCGFETGSPAKYEGCKCPKCGFQDDKDKVKSEEGMTKEEAIKRLKEARNTIQPFRYVDEAIDYAIKALEHESDWQDPCEDAISRKEILNILPTFRFTGINDYLDAKSKIEKLSPVTPQPKTGHWYRKHSWEIYFTCSNCETTNASGTKYNYCPSCGARMAEREG